MDGELDAGDLAGRWRLDLDALTWIETKAAARRLGLAAQLRHYALTGRFAETAEEIPTAAAQHLADQLDRPVADLAAYAWTGRSALRHRVGILRLLAIRPAASGDLDALSTWLEADVCPRGENLDAMMAAACRWCLGRGHQAPSRSVLGRLTRSARRRFEDRLVSRLAAGLSPEAAARMEATLAGTGDGPSFAALKADPGRVALESVLRVAGRLSFIRGLALPREALSGVGPPVIERLRRRVAQENGWEMRRHPRERRLGLFALYLLTREAALVDGLVDLLIETVHKIGVKAERRAAAALVRDVERVHGKERLLVDIAAAAVDHPDDPVRTAIFPVAGEGLARVRSWLSIAPAAAGTGRCRPRCAALTPATTGACCRGSWRRSTSAARNAAHRPVLEALERIGRARAEGKRVLRLGDGLPLGGIVPRPSGGRS